MPPDDIACSRRKTIAAALLLPAVGLAVPSAAYSEATALLRSWENSVNRSAIIDFVTRITKVGSADFVPAEARVAVFDNDGTLWCEKPMYVQGAFVLDRVRALAPQHPEWRHEQPFAAVLSGDWAAVASAGEAGVEALTMATHAGMTTTEFTTIVSDWIRQARDQRFRRPYTDLVYQPMVELMAYLRQNGFSTFIVTGGGVEFVRPWSEHIYGIPPEQVVGSSIKTRFEMRDSKPVLVRQREVEFVNDGPSKPVGINHFIGRRPIFAAGNSDGDLQMLQWTTYGSQPSFGMLIHHTDAAREYAYDRTSPVGRLDKAFDLAQGARWTVVDMKADWRRVFSFDG